MSPLLILALVWLMHDLSSDCASVPGANGVQSNSVRGKSSGVGLFHCGNEPFNPAEATCCSETKLTPGLSQNVASCCGEHAYDSINELCCNSTVMTKPAAKAECCGNVAIDVDRQLCCGPIDDKVVLPRNSSSHLCCGHDSFDSKTQCCCLLNEELKKMPRNHICCSESVNGEPEVISCGPSENKKKAVRKSIYHQCCGQKQYDTRNESCIYIEDDGELKITRKSEICAGDPAVQKQSPVPEPARTSVCGSSFYNLDEFRCERKQAKSPWCCSTGRCDAAPTLYNANTHVCCDGCVSKRTSWTDQCRGDTLHTGRADGEKTSEAARCGTETYDPNITICCDGHRHHREQGWKCCGAHAYNITNQEQRCCGGRLYNNTDRQTQCCGSVLKKTQDVCCTSEDRAVLYSDKPGFRCCSHLYYNTSLWSCQSGELSPSRHTSNLDNCPVLSLNNVKAADLCEQIRVGTVESVSRHSVILSAAMMIQGRRGSVELLPSPHLNNMTNGCTVPPLTPGKSYFFLQNEVVVDHDHESFLVSIDFIISKCRAP